jgi:hypothetical protein
MLSTITRKIKNIEVKLDRSIAFLLRIDYGIPVKEKLVAEKAKVVTLQRLAYKHGTEALGTAC